jgi:hypothetical protein
MPDGRRLMAAVGRHRRMAATVAVGSALVVMAGAWILARHPAGTDRHQIRTATTIPERTDFLPAALGRCSWPLRIHGKPARGQIYLTRCYLRALAHRDAATMHELSEFVPQNNFSSRITGRDTARSADARAGAATVTFIQNPVDSAQTAVEITFADGARESLGMADISLVLPDPAPYEGDAWRFAIGSDIQHLG